MASNEQLDFYLGIKKDELGPALDKNTKKAQLLENTLSTALGVIGGIAVTKGIGLLKEGFDALVNTFKKGVAAAAEEEKAINDLNNSLQRTGTFSQQASAELIAFATGLQKASVFGDEVVIQNTALLNSLASLNKDGLKQGIQAAADFATVLGIDLETATRLVAKAANGNTEAFKRYGVEIKQGSTDAESFKNTLAALNTQFGGAAQSQISTYAGATAQLKNSYGDLLEVFGRAIIENDGVKASIKDSSQIVQNLSDIVSKVAPSIIDNLAGIAKFLIVEPAKFWTNLFSGKETEGLDQVNTGLEKVQVKIAALSEFLEQNKKGGILDGTFTTRQEGINKLAALIDREQALLNSRNKIAGEGGTAFVGPIQDKTDPVEKTKERNAELIKQEQTLNAEIAAIRGQFASEQLAFQDQLDILQIEDATLKREAEIFAIAEQKLRENEAVYNGELLKNQTIADAQLRALADKKAADTKRLNDEKANSTKELEIKKAQLENEKKIAADRVANQSSTFATIATLSNSNNKTLAAIGKAAGVTQIAIDTPVAIGKALSAFPPPFNFAAAGLVGAAMAAQAARIAGVQFAGGGFIDGNGGATMGPDNTLASVRSGEMILNGEQQAKLFDAVNSGGIGGGNIIIQVNGREIARAVRDEVRRGFTL